MLIALLLATVFAAAQGRIVYMTFPEEAGVKAMQIRWNDREIPVVHAAAKWETIVGVDVDVKAGDHDALLEVSFADGRVQQTAITFRVEGVKFPTTELKVDDQYVQLSPANAQRAAREAKDLERIYAVITPQILWTKPFATPVKGQTKGSNFGHRRVFNGQPRAPHAGSDLKATTGTPIQATNRGRLVLAKKLFFTGNRVVVDPGLGIYTIYAHLSRIDVKVNQMVELSQLLGLAGATGRVTGPHLHWGTRIQGARVDPFSLLSIE
jgi:murein DD-endopeptidase MepM/ murein hydrolase activator NlpD